MKSIIKKILKPFQNGIQKLIGINYITYKFERDINALKDSNDAIYYYLNNYLLKAKDLPPTSDPDLRIMQLCDAEMLKIVDKILTKHNLTYWLDFGTLLGAVRHKGFIPWDDDMDISVPEETYYETLRVLKDELSRFPKFNCYELPHRPFSGICLGYSHEETGIWLDIFSNSSAFCQGGVEDFVPILKNRIWKYKQKYKKVKDKMSAEEIANIRKDIIKGDTNSSKIIHFFSPERNPEFINSKIYYKEEYLYPLIDIEFESHIFKAPHDSDSILKIMYGKSYMELAKQGVLHHSEGRPPLSTWAKLHNVNMDFILAELKSIYESI